MSENDWLQRELEREPVIADAGFTQGVLASLPPSRRMSNRVRAVVIIFTAAFAAAFGLFALDGAAFLHEALRAGTLASTSGLSDARSAAVISIMVLAMVVTAVSAVRDS